jgi:phage tail protein X
VGTSGRVKVNGEGEGGDTVDVLCKHVEKRTMKPFEIVLRRGA